MLPCCRTQIHPSGCCVQFVLLSTHGDPYYVGLNGIALYDPRGQQIDIQTDQLQVCCVCCAVLWCAVVCCAVL
jgi:hypothetical protein